MKSKTSFINKGILHNDFKRYGWMGVVYLLAWLSAVPLQLVMISSRPEIIKVHYTASTYLRVFEFNNSPLSLFLLLMAPVLAGLLIFRYLQTGKAADLEHSLPIRRETLYNTHLLSGLVLLLFPVMITALVTWAVITGLKIDYVQGQHILNWLKVALTANLLLFSTTVAVGMITGLSALQGLLTYILLLVPSGLTDLVLYNLKMYLYGFAYDYFSVNLDRLSPLLNLASPNLDLKNSDMIVYLLVSIGLCYIGRYLYRIRPIEAAGDAVTLGPLRPLLKYSVTFCTMLLGGSYFYSTQQSLAWTYLGYFLGALSGYILIEILFHKSVHVFTWQRFKGLGVYAAVMLVLLGLIRADIIGYETRLPQIDEVKYVYMDYSFYSLLQAKDKSRTVNQFPQAIYVDRDNIAHILVLHREIIAEREEAQSTPVDGNIRQERICLAYQLNNGNMLLRNYLIDSSRFAWQLKPIYESLEYKTQKNEVLRINPMDAKLVDIRSEVGYKRVSITDPQLIQEVVAVLQNDIKTQSYEEMTDRKPPWGYIEITLPDEDTDQEAAIRTQAVESTVEITPKTGYRIVTAPWQKSYSGLEDWLQGKGLYNQVRLQPGKDIVHAIIEYFPQGMDEARLRMIKADRDFEEKPGQFKVTEADKLELCLQNYQEYHKTKGAVYMVFFQLDSGLMLNGILTPSSAPDFVKQHFNR